MPTAAAHQWISVADLSLLLASERAFPEKIGAGARLEEIEYIIVKSITRNGSVTLADWNRGWHDHKQEIEAGRVQVLDLPPDEAKKAAELISTTDGIIFHLWSNDQEVLSGRVVIPQSVGHLKLTESELKKGAQESVSVSKKKQK